MLNLNLSFSQKEHKKTQNKKSLLKCLHNLSPFTPEITPARRPLFDALCDWSLSEEARRETLKMIGRIELTSFLTLIGQQQKSGAVTGELIILVSLFLPI